MSNDNGMKPCLLLVEDDPISRNFMTAVLEALSVRVDAAESAAQARAMPGPYALWLIDANLPDGSGAQLLAELRRLSPHTSALAHTADDSIILRERLLAAGFSEVLVKPISAARLHQAIRRILPDAPDALDWDEAAALKALNGNGEHVAMLRQLFLDELPGSIATVDCAFGQRDRETLRSALHKLRASCGFVGAARLAVTVERFQQAPDSAEAHAAFAHAARALLPPAAP